MDTDAANEAKASEKLVDEEDKGKAKLLWLHYKMSYGSEAFVPAMKRLLSNKLFMYNLGSSVFYVFAFMGFGTFMPKYMEFQFRSDSISCRFFFVTNAYEYVKLEQI